MTTPGTLFLVATPIGNLEDVTLRALSVLRDVDLVACEDTRRTRKLLTHFDLHQPLFSVPSHDEARRAARLAERLAEGNDVAFVTDAGMPAVSDPGAEVVRAAVRVGARVVPVPGPSAALAALAASGLGGGGRFHFLGFLPRKGGERSRLLERAAAWPGPVVLHEAPSRLAATLRDLAEAWGAERPAAVCRELTKLHEEIARGTLAELARTFSEEARGEITLVVAGAESVPEPEPDPEDLWAEVQARVADGARLKDACKAVAERHGASARELYQEALRRAR